MTHLPRPSTTFHGLPQVGAYCIFLSALLTVSYRGLVELSKSFLDPFGLDGTYRDLRLQALVAEVNAGSTKWATFGNLLPFKLAV